MIKNILFFYSLALAVFVSISGFVGAGKLQASIFQIIFLPVVLYFFIKAIKIIRKKEGSGGNLGTSVVFFSLIILTLLLGTSLNKIFFAKKETPPTPASSSVPSPTPSPQEALKKIVVVIEDSSPSVNIRQKPTIYSEIIKKVNDGDIYEALEEEAEWFKIKLEEGLEGYISKRYAKLNQDE